MARVIRYIFISFFAILLMSHNAFAADVSFDATVKVGNFPSTVYYCATYAPSGYYTNGQCNQRYWVSNAANQIRYDSGNTSVAGMKFFTPSGYSGVYNDLVQFEFDIMQGSGSANNAIDISLITLRSNTSNFDVIDVSADRISNNTTHVKVLLWAKGNFSSNTPVILIPANVETANSNYYESNFAWFREVGDLISGGLVNVFHIRSSGGQFDDSNIVESLDEVKEAIQDSQNAESEAANDATEEAQTQSDNSQSSVDGATTNLIGALGSIGSALTNAPATDCIINITTRNFSIGQVNLCSNVPQEVLNFVSGLLAIVLTPIVLYYIFHIITYMYNLFQEFQR